MFSEQRLATQHIDEGERVEYWQQAMRTVLRAECRVEPLEPGFGAALQALPCGALDLILMQGSAYRVSRVGGGRSGWVAVLFQTGGVCSLSDRGTHVQLAPGDACIVPPAHDIVIDRPTPFTQVVLNVPETELDAGLPDWRARLMRRIPGESPPVLATSALLRYVLGHHRLLDGGDRERLGATALHLLEGLRGAPARTRQQAGGPMRLADFHRRRIEDWLRRHLREADLSVARLAGELGLSQRYVHKLFAARRQSVMGWVREQRLEACRREITARGKRSIADIAGTWGFESPAHFSRTFRKRFGVAPSQL